MAKGFNLTAQINLRGPTNLKPIVADIRRQLGTISSDINVKISPQAAKSVDTVTRRLRSMNDAIVAAKNNTNDLNNALSGLSSSLSSIGAAGNKSASAINNTATSSQAAAKNIKVATTEMEQFGKQSALAIRRFAAFSTVSSVIYGLINAINSGFSAFVSFDKELVKLQQVTGKGEIGLKALENQITKLATSLGISSESLVNVASTLAQAGLNAEDTRIALAALAKTELAPSFDNLTDTTEGAIAALRQFELQAGDLESALGSINAVAAAFAVESRDIITAIQRTGGVFASASKGVSQGKDALNEFVAIFTSVRATTRESAETIATGLRTIFTRIQRKGTIEALREYGVILTDLEGKFVGPYEAVKRLSEGLKSLDPRDLRFSQIVEELGGFRQIGKVIPLIQQFAEAQKALRVAQTGQSSLTEAQITAQKSLANQIAKVREQFLTLIRDVGKSATFQAITKIVLGLTSAFISLAGAFKPILPFLAILGTIKGVKAIGEFGTGFFGGLKSGGGGTAKNVGSNIGSTISGGKEKERAAATKLATDAIQANTNAIKSLTSAVSSLENTIKSRPTTLSGGGKVLGFNSGGIVPGSGRGDKVPALLEPGEVVINNRAANKYGRGNLVRMNRYAIGGPISIEELEKRSGSSSIKNAYSDTIQPKDKISGELNRKPSIVSPNDKQWDIVREKAIGYYEKYKAKNPEASDKKLKNIASGDAFEDFIASLTGGTRTRPNYPVDVIGKRNPIEAKFTAKKTAEADLLSKLFRYRYEQNSLGGYNFSSKIDKNVFLGQLDVFEMGRGEKKKFQELYRFVEGGRIKKFANAGKVEPYYGQVEVEAAKAAQAEYEKSVSDAFSMENIYFDVLEGKSIAEGVTPEVFGTGIGSLPKGAPGVVGRKKVRLSQAINDKAPVNVAALDAMVENLRKVAMNTRAAQIKAYTDAEDSIVAFKNSGLLENLDPKILEYIKQTISDLQQGTVDPDIWDESSIADITKKLTPSNLQAFAGLTQGKKVEVQGQRTKLGEVFNAILESYGSKVSPMEQSNITSVVADKLIKEKARAAAEEAKTLSLGGMVQKFVVGGVAKKLSGSALISGPHPNTPSGRLDLANWRTRISKLLETGGSEISFNPDNQTLIATKSGKVVSLDNRTINSKSLADQIGPDALTSLQILRRRLEQAYEEEKILADQKNAFILTDEEKASAKPVAIAGFRSDYKKQRDAFYKKVGGKPLYIHLGILPQDKMPVLEELWESQYQLQRKAASKLLGSETSLATLSEEDRMNLGMPNAQGYDLEVLMALMGAYGGKKSSQDAVDFLSGLQPDAAAIFGIPPGIPTQAKLTVNSNSIGDGLNGIIRAMNFAFGGKAEGPGFEEVKKQIMDKYPDINFRISKRKRGFGYNVMGALKSAGELHSAKGLKFEQASNLEKLRETADKMANGLINPQTLAAGGLAEETKKQKNFGQIALRSDGSSIAATYFKQGADALLSGDSMRSGSVTAKKISNDLYAVALSAATKGYGPRLYDAVMEEVTQQGGMLTSDRSSVSDDAKRIWQYYFNNRGDVKKTPLDPKYWTNNSALLDPKLYGKKETWPPPNDQAWILQSGYSKSPSLINDPNSVTRLASGGTVPAMVSNGEAFVPPALAKKIGYGKLNKMNQADRNGMSGFAGGGISVFKGAGSGTSDSIGPIGLPEGSFIIRQKATKALGLNKGGFVGSIKRFFRGGIADKDVARAQGTVLTDIKQAEKTFAMIMGQLGKGIRASIINNFKGIESVTAGGKTSLGTTFSEGTRGQAAFNKNESVMGLQIQGKKVAATTETVAHETGHLADFALGGKKDLASETQGTFQFALVNKVKPVMEKAFVKAGKSADQIAKYLASNQELFAEFFAKASPQVRAIITSTTDAEIGMKMLADHLGDVGYTFAGLEASDIIDPWESVKDAMNKTASTVSSIVGPPNGGGGGGGNGGGGSGGGGPPGGPPDDGPFGLGPEDPGAKKRREQNFADQEFFKYKAAQTGMSESGVKLDLAQKLGKATYEIGALFGGRVSEAKTGLVTRRESAMKIGGSITAAKEAQEKAKASGDQEALKAATQQLADANTRLSQETEAILQEMAALRPDLAATEEGMKKLAAGASAVADDLRSGDLQAAQQKLEATTAGSEKGGALSDKEKADIARARVSKETGVDAGLLERQFGPGGASAKMAEQQAFIQSRQGQRFGKLAEFAPGLTQKLSKTKIGQGLGGAADFISGKGGKFSQGFAKLGGFQGIGSGIAVGSEALRTSGLISKKTLKDPNVAGAFGALQGAGSMAATGAQLGSFAGPIGTLIGGVGGAIIGGIKGFFDAKNAQVLSNALDAVTKSSVEVDKAFKELAQNDTDANFQNLQKAAGKQIEASQKLDAIAFDETSYFLGGQSQANKEEALRGRAGVAGTNVETFSRMAERQLGRMSTEQLGEVGKGGKNVIAEQYKESAIAAAEAANGTRNLTAAQQKKIGQNAMETAYLDAYMKQRKEAGATDQQIAEDILADRKLALQEGKQALDIQSQAAAKQALLARATKEVALATENLLDVYRRVGANAQRFSDEIDDMLGGTQATISSLGGKASVRNVDRSGSERILGNMAAYSSEEVKAATDEMVGKLGGGKEAQDLGRQAQAAKFLQDKLPGLLRQSGADPKEIINQLSGELKTMGLDSDAIDKMLGEIETQIGKNKEGGLGTLADEIASGGIDKFSMTAAEAAKVLQNLSKTYNDALQKSVDLQNQYNEVIMQSNEYLRKAGSIRINAELDLAKALGNTPTLQQLNEPFDFEIRDLTKGLVPGGTTDPAAIAAGITAKTEQNQALQKANANIQNQGMAGATPGQAGAQLLAEQQKNIAAMGANSVAINEGRQALEKLANDGTKAANALAKIEEQQRQIEGLGNRFEKIFTAGPEELFKMERQSAALGAAQVAGPEQFKSRAFRQDAFAGLEQDKEFLSTEEYRKQRGMLMRKSLEAQGYTGQSMIQKGGINMTVDDFIKRIEGGMPNEEDPNVKAYREAVNTQIKANLELANLEKLKSEEIQTAMTGLQEFLATEFPRILTEAVKASKEAGATKPETKGKVSEGEKSRAEADKAYEEAKGRKEETDKQLIEEKRALARAKDKVVLEQGASTEVKQRQNKIKDLEKKSDEEAKNMQQATARRVKADQVVAKERRDAEAAKAEQAKAEQKTKEEKVSSATDQSRKAREGVQPIQAPPAPGTPITTVAPAQPKPQVTQQTAATTPIATTVASTQTTAQVYGATTTKPQVAPTGSAPTPIQKLSNKEKARLLSIAAIDPKKRTTEQQETYKKLRERNLATSPEAMAKQDKKTKREEYLLKQNPRTRARLLTKAEREAGLGEKLAQKEEEAKKQESMGTTKPTPITSTTAGAQQTIPLGGIVGAATPGAERVTPSDPNVLKPQPVPSNLPQPVEYTRQVQATETGTTTPTGPKPTETTAQLLTLDPASLEGLNTFNTTFGSYVDKLVGFQFPTIPEKIEMVGNHVVDVRVSGAAAFESLQKGVKDMINKAIDDKMTEIWKQTGGAIGTRPGTLPPKGK